MDKAIKVTGNLGDRVSLIGGSVVFSESIPSESRESPPSLHLIVETPQRGDVNFSWDQKNNPARIDAGERIRCYFSGEFTDERKAGIHLCAYELINESGYVLTRATQPHYKFQDGKI